jgi:hypothetical protein
MEDDGGAKIKIVKVNRTATVKPTKRGKTAKAPTPIQAVKHTSKHRTATPKHGVLKHGKTARKAPRFEAVRDPAKSPPVKKTSRLRILTEMGAKTRRAKIVADAKKKPIGEIRAALRKHNLNVKEQTPEHLARKIYEDAQEAGMIVSG